WASERACCRGIVGSTTSVGAFSLIVRQLRSFRTQTQDNTVPPQTGWARWSSGQCLEHRRPAGRPTTIPSGGMLQKSFLPADSRPPGHHACLLAVRACDGADVEYVSTRDRAALQ